MAEPTAEAPAEAPLRDEKGRFLPGQSGHPGGRPHKRHRAALQELEDMLAEAMEDGRTKLRALLERLFHRAVHEDSDACMRLLLERIIPQKLAVDAMVGADETTVHVLRSFAGPRSEVRLVDGEWRTAEGHPVREGSTATRYELEGDGGSSRVAYVLAAPEPAATESPETPRSMAPTAEPEPPAGEPEPGEWEEV